MTDESTTAARGRWGRAGDDLELVIFDGSGLRRARLSRGTEITIGRGEEATIRVDDPSVSRLHACFRGGTSEGEPATIEDLGSSNGTRIGPIDARSGTPVPIASDSLVVLGELRVVVRETRTSETPPPRSRPETSMSAVWKLVDLVAPSELSVLVLGETGVGKEVVSRALHEKSKRASGPLLFLNCAALPEQTLESELFGHEKGAFTGAQTTKPGLLEAAEKGTLVLDEVGELTLATQAKLLRALDAGEILRLGSVKPRRVDVRVVAATNRDLGEMTTEGTFRSDLLYRLDGITIHVPPLRERRDEIRSLAKKFAGDVDIASEALRDLEEHSWPGNVRELKKVIERAVVLAAGGRIDAAHVVVRAPANKTPTTGPLPLREERARSEEQSVKDALAACNGNQTRAAAMLGISRRALIERLDKFGLPRPRKS